MKIEKEILNQFGQMLIGQVRDIVFSQFNDVIKFGSNNELDQKIHNATNKTPEEFQEEFPKIMLEIIDSTMHYFLWMIEQNEDYDLIGYTRDRSFVSIRDQSDGLSGELYSEDGWIQKYSEYIDITYEDVITQKTDHDIIIDTYKSDQEEAKRLLVRVLCNRENIEKLKKEFKISSVCVIRDLVVEISKKTNNLKDECQELIKTIKDLEKNK